VELKLDTRSGIDPNDEDFQEAQEACQDLLPGIGSGVKP
jgi:hypothetical protein